MADKFRIGISPALATPAGEPLFPSYELSALETDPAFELTEYQVQSPLQASDLTGFDALILLGERMAAESFPGDGRLALICRMGVGYDTVDVPACDAHDVALTITPESARRPMAQATLTLILALAGRLFVKDRIARQGPDGWRQRTDHHGLALNGRTLGLIGVGNIGREVLKLAAPFDMRIVGYDPALDESDAARLGFEPMATDEIFRTADFITLHCPLTARTRHLVNRERLALMKPEAFLINTARGPVVDQQALAEVLGAGRIAGAALDVMDPEPSAASEALCELDNVILTPHALGWTDDMFAQMAAGNMAAIRAVAAGRAPVDVVNSDVLSAAGFQAKLGTYRRG